MPPQTLSLIIWALQELIAHEPEIAAAIKLLFTKADPTPADWQALHDKIALKSYRDYVPASALHATAPDLAMNAGTPVPITVLPTPAAAQSQPPTVTAASQPPVTPGPVTPEPVNMANSSAAPDATRLDAQPAGREVSIPLGKSGPVEKEKPRLLVSLNTSQPGQSQPDENAS